MARPIIAAASQLKDRVVARVENAVAPVTDNIASNIRDRLDGVSPYIRRVWNDQSLRGLTGGEVRFSEETVNGALTDFVAAGRLQGLSLKLAPEAIALDAEFPVYGEQANITARIRLERAMVKADSVIIDFRLAGPIDVRFGTTRNSLDSHLPGVLLKRFLNGKGDGQGDVVEEISTDDFRVNLHRIPGVREYLALGVEGLAALEVLNISASRHEASALVIQFSWGEGAAQRVAGTVSQLVRRKAEDLAEKVTEQAGQIAGQVTDQVKPKVDATERLS
jgi:hypothetical protein